MTKYLLAIILLATIAARGQAAEPIRIGVLVDQSRRVQRR